MIRGLGRYRSDSGLSINDEIEANKSVWRAWK
jgi:hypothetical protein